MRLAQMIQAVDAHACGEPGRVIVGGVLDVPGATMFEKMQHLQTHADGLRKLMLREPRGYPAANCNLILPPTRPEADAGYVIMEQVEYPGMSGTNTICVTTVLLETGMLEMREPVTELTLELVGIGQREFQALLESAHCLGYGMDADRIWYSPVHNVRNSAIDLPWRSEGSATTESM